MVASRLTLAWARLYTRGMHDDDRRARLDELASDLWEHREAALAGRRRGVQIEIAGRTARGAVADLAWRFTHRSGSLPVTTTRVAGWTAFAAGTALLLTFSGISGAPVLGVYSVDDWDPGAARENARVMASIFAVLAAGVALLWRRPRTGTALLALAGASLSLYAGWFWPLLVPCTVASIAGGLAIARRRGSPRGAAA